CIFGLARLNALAALGHHRVGALGGIVGNTFRRCKRGLAGVIAGIGSDVAGSSKTEVRVPYVLFVHRLTSKRKVVVEAVVGRRLEVLVRVRSVRPLAARA